MPVNIPVPDLGESVVEATVLRWLKQEGDRVTPGETLLELETEKVNLQVNAPQAGVLVRIEHRAGEDVKIGDVLGAIEPAPSQESRPPTAAGELPAAEPKPPAVVSEPPRVAEPHVGAPREINATPIAQRMAEEYGIDLRQVPASSSAPRITKQDVEKYREEQRAQPIAPPSAPSLEEQEAPVASPLERTRREERVKLSRRRQTIARRLVEAQHAAAMLTTFNEVDMSSLMELRRLRKEAFKQRYGVSLGITSFFVKAAIGALRAFPQLNAEIQGDEMVLKHYYDLGIAVGAVEGLVVPVLRDADHMSFADIEKKIGEFAQKAEQATLSLDELRGGTFTITNGGVFGSLLSTPILNPPQVGILGLHKIEDRPIARDGQVVIRPMMYVALSYDHRLVDGREAVQFVVRVKELIEDPTALLLES